MEGLFFEYHGELLHQASIFDQSDFLVQMLNTKINGDANSKDPQGRSPVHTAAQHGSKKCLKILLDAGGTGTIFFYDNHFLFHSTMFCPVGSSWNLDYFKFQFWLELVKNVQPETEIFASFISEMK